MRAVITAAVLVAACRPSGLTQTSEGLAVEPPQLGFGDVVIGSAAQRTVTLRNTGSPGRPVQLSVQAPFTVAETSLVLEGGESRGLAVTFIPAGLGPATGALRVDGLEVPLAGTGVAADCSALNCDDGSPCTLDDCEDGACWGNNSAGEYAPILPFSATPRRVER